MRIVGKSGGFSLKRIGIVLLVVFVVCLFAVPIFMYFNMKIKARNAYREAKNVKLYLRTLDIQYYASGQTIYDANKSDGLRKGVLESVEELLEHDCSLRLISYNKSKREVTGFIYTYDKFQIIYHYDEEKGDVWEVNYIFKVIDYE